MFTKICISSKCKFTSNVYLIIGVYLPRTYLGIEKQLYIQEYIEIYLIMLRQQDIFIFCTNKLLLFFRFLFVWDSLVLNQNLNKKCRINLLY